jgi:hypothetical protein
MQGTGNREQGTREISSGGSRAFRPLNYASKKIQGFSPGSLASGHEF